MRRRAARRARRVVAVNARTGAVAERIKNPDVTGAPRPVEPLFGFDHWITLHQIGTVVDDGHAGRGLRVGWRRHPGHPVLLMVLATTLLVWQDPIMNWAPYAVYNPQLWHWPETWPLVSLSPTVEPFIVIGYATFYMAPFFPADLVILRRLQARRPVESFVWRHPLLSLSALILADRVRVRRVARDLPRPHPALHLLPRDPVGLLRRGRVAPVPAHLGVGCSCRR